MLIVGGLSRKVTVLTLGSLGCTGQAPRPKSKLPANQVRCQQSEDSEKERKFCSFFNSFLDFQNKMLI